MSRHTSIALGIFLMSTAWSDAASKDQPLTIRVLSAKTETIPVDTGANDVPKDCSLTDFSAYCNQSRTAKVCNTMLVRDGSGNSFTISCMVDSRWSRCVSLPAGEAFEAQKEQRGFAVWYRNSKGKEVKQSYALVSTAGAPAATPASQPGSEIANPANRVEDRAPAVVLQDGPRTAKCHFTSTPAGAEISIDGRYVGDTPSIITVGAGTHVIMIFMPGFAEWKREIAVSSGSDVNVGATLAKVPQ